MNLLFPTFKLRYLPPMLGLAIAGAAVAGLYGILHDQVTYSISPEYFTKLKFTQFHYADFGWPRRVLVSEIGFLATWWAGFFAGWFLARIAVPAWPLRLAIRRVLTGFLIIVSSVLLAGGIGYYLGLTHGPDYANWAELCWTLDVSDVPAFVRVAYIHNAGYLGGLIGLIVAIAWLIKLKNSPGTVETICRKIFGLEISRETLHQDALDSLLISEFGGSP